MAIQADPDLFQFNHGDIVIDRDDPSNEAVVVNTPPHDASEWNVYRGTTLAEDNPEYPEDDAVIVVVYCETLEESFPYYSGGRPISLSTLSDQDTAYYAFPESRLAKVGVVRTHEIELQDLSSSPYHARSFDAEEELRLIAMIERDGRPPVPPLVRVEEDDHFTILNGHKRAWAAHVAGLDAIYCQCLYIDDWEAATIFARCHLDPDEPQTEDPSSREAIRLLRERWGDRADELPGINT